MYQQRITTGDRVALAPHLDLWMAGVRYATVTQIWEGSAKPLYLIDWGNPEQALWVERDDLLGPVGR